MVGGEGWDLNFCQIKSTGVGGVGDIGLNLGQLKITGGGGGLSTYTHMHYRLH